MNPSATIKNKSNFVVMPKSFIETVMNMLLAYDNEVVNTPKAICNLLLKLRFWEKNKNEFHAIYLDSYNRIIGMELISSNTQNSTLVDPGEVFRGALLAQATGVILVTVHASDDATPGDDEKQMTKMMMGAGEMLKIKVLEHVIIASNKDCYSFRTASRVQV